MIAVVTLAGVGGAYASKKQSGQKRKASLDAANGRYILETIVDPSWQTGVEYRCDPLTVCYVIVGEDADVQHDGDLTFVATNDPNIDSVPGTFVTL